MTCVAIGAVLVIVLFERYYQVLFDGKPISFSIAVHPIFMPLSAPTLNQHGAC